MARPKREKITAEQITGLKFFRILTPLLERLADDGCRRDRAGNRTLHYDQYCLLVLLALFNPVIGSLRALQQASELKNVQKKLGCARASLGSLSESSHVFDPELLEEVIAQLGRQLAPVGRDPRLQDVPHVVTAVDGSLLKALPSIVEAAYLRTVDGRAHYAWRLHAHFEIDRHVPTRCDLTGGKNTGPAGEKAVLRQSLQPDHCYLMDRGYAQFTLFNDIVRAQSSYVCRLRDNSQFEVQHERPLSEEARQAGVLSDQVVRLGLSSRADARPDHPIRLVVVRTEPHQKRGGRKGKTAGPSSTGTLLIATNLLDVPAEIIALLYRYRWTIEIFFRFFKHVLGCRHLLSQHPHGIRIQTYCAIIACMLISLWTGKRPTLRTYEMICHDFSGLADEEELRAHIARLKNHDA